MENNELKESSPIEEGTYYTYTSSIIERCNSCMINRIFRNICLSKQIVKKVLATSMISMLMPYYGGFITNEEWANLTNTKYFIAFGNKQKSIIIYESIYSRHFLAFHTKKQAIDFLKNNEQLVKSYFMV